MFFCKIHLLCHDWCCNSFHRYYNEYHYCMMNSLRHHHGLHGFHNCLDCYCLYKNLCIRYLYHHCSSLVHNNHDLGTTSKNLKIQHLNNFLYIYGTWLYCEYFEWYETNHLLNCASSTDSSTMTKKLSELVTPL